MSYPHELLLPFLGGRATEELPLSCEEIAVLRSLIDGSFQGCEPRVIRILATRGYVRANGYASLEVTFEGLVSLDQGQRKS
jgi:hypothetical protein